MTSPAELSAGLFLLQGLVQPLKRLISPDWSRAT